MKSHDFNFLVWDIDHKFISFIFFLDNASICSVQVAAQKKKLLNISSSSDKLLALLFCMRCLILTPVFVILGGCRNRKKKETLFDNHKAMMSLFGVGSIDLVETYTRIDFFFISFSFNLISMPLSTLFSPDLLCELCEYHLDQAIFIFHPR
ncbi:hypothetical protein EDC96DRAFT_57550 [Choanephora cucurbitarum]|nr:hypothetical protein EDC96DRAFT_57550 [Choanephora cucurbitarum]